MPGLYDCAESKADVKRNSKVDIMLEDNYRNVVNEGRERSKVQERPYSATFFGHRLERHVPSEILWCQPEAVTMFPTLFQHRHPSTV